MSLPLENLDDKTFDELVKEAVSRIPIYAPGLTWTDHNIHDPGITFIELFAWLAEMQIYHLNRITDKSYRKFLKLMEIPTLNPAREAKVDLTFSLRDHQPTRLKAGTQVAAVDPISGNDIIFETEYELNVVDAELKAILSYPKSGEFIDETNANGNDDVYYYAFRYKPVAGDELYLGFDKSLTGEEITLAFYLYGGDLSGTGGYGEEKLEVYPSATLVWEYYTGGGWKDDGNWSCRLQVSDETRHLAASGKIRIRIEEEMGQTVIRDHNLFWLRCRIEKDGYEIPPKMDFISLNAVSAIQSKTLKECPFSSSGLPDFHIDLEHTPVREGTTRVKVKDEFSGEDDRLNIYKGGWGAVEDFDASKPESGHYTVDLATGRVTFGDGINGRIPPEGKNDIIISYCSGGGVRGNVKAGAINRVLDLDNKPAEKVTVINMRVASGGEEAETLDEAKIRARKDLKRVYRAVTSVDYEHLAMNTPGLRVARAKAIPRYHPDRGDEVPGIVAVIVVPESPYAKPKPSLGFLRTVYRHLDKHRLLATELFIMPPEYVEISVVATVVIKPKKDHHRVQDDIKKELGNFLHPIKGGADRGGWHFGRPVYRSEIYKIIDGVEGVDYVTDLRLKREGRDQPGDIMIPPHSLVFHKKGFTDITIKKGDSHG